MKYLSLILTFFLYGCASFKDKYTCLEPQNFKEGNLQRCQDKQTKLYGTYNIDKQEWVFKPIYKEYLSFKKGSRFFLREPNEEKFSTILLEDMKFVKTDFKRISTVPLRYEYGSGRNYYAIDSKGAYHNIDNEYGTIIEFFRKNVDQSITNEFGATVPPLIPGLFGHYNFVRFIEKEKTLYQFLDGSGLPQGPKYAAENVKFFINDKFIIPFEVIDAKRKLYWPIVQYYSTTYLKRPEGILGVAIAENYHWIDGSDISDRYPSISRLLVVRKEKNKPEQIQLIPFDILDKTYKEIKNSLINEIDGESRYTDLKWHTRKEVSRRGNVYEKSFPYVKNKDGKYVYMNNWNYFDDSKDAFNTEAELLSFLDNRSTNIQTIAAQVIKKNEDIINEQMRLDSERRYQENAAKEARLEDTANADDANRARDRAESDAAWGRVGNQLQDAAIKAKSKADCINKQTKTKKAYLEKKQGWYETGGCD